MWKIEGEDYDLTNFINTHPGGKISIESMKGEECSQLLIQYHPNINSTLKYLQKYKINKNVEHKTQLTSKGFYKDLREVVKTKIGTKRSDYYWDTKSLMGFWSIGMPLYLLFFYMTLNVNSFFGIPLGVAWTMFNGRNLHEATHRTVFRNKYMARIFEVISHAPISIPLLWHYQHNVSHHSFTNDYIKDVDTNYIRQVLLPLRKYKITKYIMPFIILFAGISTTFFLYVIEPFIVVTTSTYNHTLNVPKIYYSELFTYVLVNGLIIKSSLLAWVLMNISASVWFLFWSQLSHLHSDNIDNINSYEFTDNYLDVWAKNQVESSTNYMTNSWLYYYMSFGLTYQIEHHLFPYISQGKYYLITDDIERVCKAHGVKYTRINNMGTLLYSVWKSLTEMPVIKMD